MRALTGATCTESERACLESTVLAQSGAFLVRTAPGAQGRAALAALSRRYEGRVNNARPPTDLVNFGQAVDFPLIFGVIVVVFGVGTLLHLLLTSVNRKRREMGLLKSLGFVRRQVVWSVSWQTTTVALLGIVIGVPLGVAAGRVVWSAFANNLGVGTGPVVTASTIAFVALGTLLVANVLAVAPAYLAARSRPASLLRVE
jgi:predicted lysophospholipase L1 biosynthesis ABC-type transport system permease subunit